MSTLNFVLNAKGTFNINPPFNSAFPSLVPATVTGINTIGSLVADGVDVLNTYYIPFGATEVQYNADLNNEIQMITLTSDTGQIAKIPANYIAQSPIMDGIDYYNFTAIASIGMIPGSFDFTSLKKDIESVITANTGVLPNVYIAVNGDATRLTSDAAAQFEVLRKTAMANRANLYNQNIALQAEVASLQAQLKQISEYLISNNLVKAG